MIQILVFTLALVLSSCSLKDPKELTPKVAIKIEDSQDYENEINLLKYFAVETVTLPTSASGFNCVAVNVNYPGVISNNKAGNCTIHDNFQNRGKGILIEPFPKNSLATAEIQSGEDRIFDVYGMFPMFVGSAGTECKDDPAIPYPNRGFFIGSKKVDILSGGTINILTAFPNPAATPSMTTNPSLTCDDHNQELVFGNINSGHTFYYHSFSGTGDCTSIPCSNTLNTAALQNAVKFPNDNLYHNTAAASSHFAGIQLWFNLNNFDLSKYTTFRFNFIGSAYQSAGCTGLSDTIITKVYNGTTFTQITGQPYNDFSLPINGNWFTNNSTKYIVIHLQGSTAQGCLSTDFVKLTLIK